MLFPVGVGLAFSGFPHLFLGRGSGGCVHGLGLTPAWGCRYCGPVPWCTRGGELGGLEDGFFDFADFAFDVVHIVPHRAEAFQDGYDIGEVEYDFLFGDLGTVPLVFASFSLFR